MPALYLCLHVCDFPAQASVHAHPEHRAHSIAVLDGDPPLQTVFSLNQKARRLGLALGMGRLQAESFVGVLFFPRAKRQEDAAFIALMKCAEHFSPRVEVLDSPQEFTSGATLVLDVSASARLFGPAQEIATALQKNVNAAGLQANIAASTNANTAVLAARGYSGITVIPSGQEAEMLAPLSLNVLDLTPEQHETFASWGICTLGMLARLPQPALISRIGQTGYRLQALSRGECSHLLVPVEDPVDALLSESTELDHPVELLEPLLFLISRMLERIVMQAAQHALAIACVETRLALDGAVRKEHRRMVRPALPEWNHAMLLKLIQLDLEMHPPQAAVIALHLCAQPARSQSVQQGLFTPQTPEAGRLEVLLARLRKLVGEDRVGAPELLDSFSPDAFRMAPFLPAANHHSRSANLRPQSSALRILRPPRVIRVEMHSSHLTAIVLEGREFTVYKNSGPWKASGAWWTAPDWSREEWDVVLGGRGSSKSMEETRRCCRIAYDPNSRCWYLTGIYD